MVACISDRLSRKVAGKDETWKLLNYFRLTLDFATPKILTLNFLMKLLAWQDPESINAEIFFIGLGPGQI